MRLPFANLGLVPEIASSYTLQAAIGRQLIEEGSLVDLTHVMFNLSEFLYLR